MKKNKLLCHIVITLGAVLVMSTISACGKTKEAAVVTETETAEDIQEASSVEEQIGDAALPESEPETEVSLSEPAPTAPAPTEEVSEEETEEELTVDMSKVKAFDAPKTMYAIKNVNARKGPATDYESLGMIKAGETLEVIGQDEGGWYELKYKNETAFASNDFISEEDPAAALAAVQILTDPAQAAAATDQTAASAVQPAVPAVTPAQDVKVVTAPAGVLIIGDSRCVQMRDVTGGGGCSWICEKAKGYSWFESNALPRADESIGKGTKVVIALGVNDVGNVNSYASMINYKAAEWAARGAKTYFVSVNPVWENPYVTEEQVENFNATLASQLVGVRWIDTHSYLMANGYSMVDGMHYDDATNLKVYQLIIGSLR